MKRVSWFLFCLLLPLQALAQNPEQWQIQVHVPAGSYKATAYVFRFPADRYKASIFAIGRYKVPDVNLPVGPSFADVVRRNPRALVINGGFVDPLAPVQSGDSVPLGLLLVHGFAMHPFSFELRPDKKFFVASTILCEAQNGSLSLIDIGRYAAALPGARAGKTPPNPARVISDCQSALQTGPRILDTGSNTITSQDLSREPAARTVLALDRDKRLCVVMFTSPIHLRVVAAFLRGAPAPARNLSQIHDASVSVADLNPATQPRTVSGLGMYNAVNLNGAVYSVAVAPGAPKIGDPGRAQPSAVVIAAQ